MWPGGRLYKLLLFVVSRKEWSRSDGAGVDHLLAQVVLVLADGAVPFLDGLVLADENLLGDLVKETRIISTRSS